MADDRTNQGNLPELSVSELSQALKRTIETTYDFVRVRGELGRVTVARSGHMYADLKDDKAVLSTVMWKGNVGRLNFRPEEGLEVIAEGRMSTYPGRSNYQLIADTIRPAGVGALMALLEERKKKLSAEGLFAPERKRAIPTLPARIGVVTSPSGAVIRDILHRIRDRFPVRVIVWPALVQGDLASAQITAGVRGFNAMTGPDRPDVLIVARGGGSIEDLWSFNEEDVVRAVAASDIPVISGVGHETDTTLVDFAADRRAPTPTGAAEMAVPVRSELLVDVRDRETRLLRGLKRIADLARRHMTATAARLPRADALLGARRQRLDVAEAKLAGALRTRVTLAERRLNQATGRLPRPQEILGNNRARLSTAALKLGTALSKSVDRKRNQFSRPADRLRTELVTADNRRKREAVQARFDRLARRVDRRLSEDRQRTLSAGKLLETLSHKSVLARGFALVRTPDGGVVRSAPVAAAAARLTLTFADGDAVAIPEGGATDTESSPPAPTKTGAKATRRKTPSKVGKKDEQGSLF